MFLRISLVGASMSLIVAISSVVFFPDEPVDQLVDVDISLPQATIAYATHELKINVSNKSRAPVRIIGLSWC